MNHHAGQIGVPGMTVEIDESKFGKTKFNRGRYIEGQWVFGGICRQRDKDTLTHHSSPHIAGYMRDERHAQGLRLPKRRGLHSSHSQPKPKLCRPWPRCAHTAHWKFMVGSQTKYASHRTSKDLFESCLQEWLWRQHYGDNPFGNIIKHIGDLYEVCKDA